MEAEYGLTEGAMTNNRYAADATLAVRIFELSVQDQEESEKEGRPIFKMVPYIEIIQPGNKDNITVTPCRQAERTRFPAHWEKWKNRTSNAEILVGTPLAEWPGCTRAQADELSFFNVKTVEQLANLADTNTRNMLGIVMLREKAKKYLETSSSLANLELLAEVRRENAAMKAQLEAFMAQQNVPHGTSDEVRFGPESLSTLGEAISDPLDNVAPIGSTLPKVPRKRRSKAEMDAARAV